MTSLLSHSRVTTWTVVGVASLSALVSTGVGATTAPTLQLSEPSNGRTFVVARGEHLTLTLQSTYWHVHPLVDRRSLRQIGAASVVAFAPAASHCVPGQGCGSVSVRYVAGAAGLVRLRATRTSCGEALWCSPAQRSWTALLRVR